MVGKYKDKNGQVVTTHPQVVHRPLRPERKEGLNNQRGLGRGILERGGGPPMGYATRPARYNCPEPQQSGGVRMTTERYKKAEVLERLGKKKLARGTMHAVKTRRRLAITSSRRGRNGGQKEGWI